MIIPVHTPQHPASVDNDHRDLITAMKLLSGTDCVRDASQAQRILVGLTESRHQDVASDAASIMQTGMKRGWFEQSAPKYYDLKLLAETSIANFEKPPVRQKAQLMILIAGLVTLLLGLVAFFGVEQGFAEPPTIMMAIAGLTLVLLLAFLFKIKVRSS